MASYKQSCKVWPGDTSVYVNTFIDRPKQNILAMTLYDIISGLVKLQCGVRNMKLATVFEILPKRKATYISLAFEKFFLHICDYFCDYIMSQIFPDAN